MNEDTFEGFTIEEAETGRAIYVCAQCEGGLAIIPSYFPDQEGIFFLICPDCGNIEKVGRISKTTVAIRNERGIWEFPKAIRALPDLWGFLIVKMDVKKTNEELGFYS